MTRVVFETPGGHYVVLDGPAREQWHKLSPSLWLLEGVWPCSAERREIAKSLRQSRRMLIVTSACQEPTTLFRHELSDNKGVRRYLRDESDDLVSVGILPFDWLPVRLRRRAEKFLTSSRIRDRLPDDLRPRVDVSAYLSPRYPVKIAVYRTGAPERNPNRSELARLADSVLSPAGDRRSVSKVMFSSKRQGSNLEILR